jgi:polar amino acid transport system substrate-binding protein
MRRRLAKLLLTLPLVATMGAGAALAQALPPAIAASKTVRIGNSPTYPPLESRDPATNQLIGFDIDLGEALAKVLGVKAEWQESVFAQLIPGLQTGRVDLVLSGISDLPARRENFDFINYLKSGAQFFTLAGNGALTAETLCGKRVGTTRSTSFPAQITAWSEEHCVKAGKPAIEVVGSDRAPLVHTELQQGRIDAAVQGSETLPALMANAPGTYRIVAPPFTVVQQGIMFPKAETGLRDAFAAALKKLFADGTYAALIAKWGLQESAAPAPLINGAPIP